MISEALPYRYINIESEEVQSLRNSDTYLVYVDIQAGQGTEDVASCWAPVLPAGLELWVAKRGLG